MARALLVGCGCRGRMLGSALLADGWAVRGSTRGAALVAIEAAGIEPVTADPDRLGTITELIGDVTVLVWLLGGAGAEINGPRLESLLEKLIDSPVRGLAFEARGDADERTLEAAAERVEAWGERFRVPVAILGADPADHEAWAGAARVAINGLLGARR